MPRTRSLAWSELKVGILTVFALVMAAILIFAVGGTGGFFWQLYPLKTVFSNVAGLKPGSPVRIDGVEVGSVDEVELVAGGVEVQFRIDEDRRPLVTTDSRATLGSISLLGEGAVDITSSTTGTPIPDWGYIPSGKAAASIAEISDQAAAGLQEANTLLKEIRSGRGTVGQLFTNDSVYREMEALLNSAEQVAAQISRGRGTLGRLTNDPALYNSIQASVADLNDVTARIRRGEGSLGKLLNDPALANSLTATSQNIEAVTGRLNRGEGTAGRLLTDDAVYNRLDSVTQRLDTVMARINDGQGTVGQLLQDKQLYENMNQAVAEMRGLLAEIRKDPKKYLNVKVSIF